MTARKMHHTEVGQERRPLSTLLRGLGPSSMMSALTWPGSTAGDLFTPGLGVARLAAK